MEGLKLHIRCCSLIRYSKTKICSISLIIDNFLRRTYKKDKNSKNNSFKKAIRSEIQKITTYHSLFRWSTKIKQRKTKHLLLQIVIYIYKQTKNDLTVYFNRIISIISHITRIQTTTSFFFSFIF